MSKAKKTHRIQIETDDLSDSKRIETDDLSDNKLIELIDSFSFQKIDFDFHWPPYTKLISLNFYI